MTRRMLRDSRSRSSGVALLIGILFLPAVPLPAQDDTDSSPYHEALLNYDAGHYDAARVAIDEAEKDRPNDVATAILKARILTELGDFDTGAALLRRYLTESGPVPVQLALGDLLLRKRDFSAAANLYQQALDLKPNDSDIILKLVYAEIGSGDLVSAGKWASQLKPLDPLDPAYYFAKAALSENSGNRADVDQDLLTVRTIYGNSMADRYLKTYLQVFAPQAKTGVTTRSEPPAKPAPSPTAQP